MGCCNAETDMLKALWLNTEDLKWVLYSEGSLGYDESFYVISDRCVNTHSDYIDIARKAAKNLPYETHLLSDTTFRKRVEQKITELQKGGTV